MSEECKDIKQKIKKNERMNVWCKQDNYTILSDVAGLLSYKSKSKFWCSCESGN